jgi:hypothetical protein
VNVLLKLAAVPASDFVKIGTLTLALGVGRVVVGAPATAFADAFGCGSRTEPYSVPVPDVAQVPVDDFALRRVEVGGHGCGCGDWIPEPATRCVRVGYHMETRVVGYHLETRYREVYKYYSYY